MSPPRQGHFLDKANPGGPSLTERRKQRKRRLDSACCPECGRPAQVADFDRIEALLRCGCGWSEAVPAMSAAYRAARVRREQP